MVWDKNLTRYERSVDFFYRFWPNFKRPRRVEFTIPGVDKRRTNRSFDKYRCTRPWRLRVSIVTTVVFNRRDARACESNFSRERRVGNSNRGPRESTFPTNPGPRENGPAHREKVSKAWGSGGDEWVCRHVRLYSTTYTVRYHSHRHRSPRGIQQTRRRNFLNERPGPGGGGREGEFTVLVISISRGNNNIYTRTDVRNKIREWLEFKSVVGRV